MQRNNSSAIGTFFMACIIAVIAIIFYVKEQKLTTDEKRTCQEPVKFAKYYLSSIQGDAMWEDFEKYYSPKALHFQLKELEPAAIIQQIKKENKIIYPNIKNIYATEYNHKIMYGNTQLNDTCLLRIYLETPVSLKNIYNESSADNKISNVMHLYLEHDDARWFVKRQTLYPSIDNNNPVIDYIVKEQNPVCFAKTFLTSIVGIKEYPHFVMLWHHSKRDQLSEEMFKKINSEAEVLYVKSTNIISLDDNGLKARVIDELNEPVPYQNIIEGENEMMVKRIEYMLIYEKGRWWMESYKLL